MMTDTELEAYGKDVYLNLRTEVLRLEKSYYIEGDNVYLDDYTIEISPRDYVIMCLAMGGEHCLLNCGERITLQGVEIEDNPKVPPGQFRVTKKFYVFYGYKKEYSQFKSSIFSPHLITLKELKECNLKPVFRPIIEELQNELQSPPSDAPSC